MEVHDLKGKLDKMALRLSLAQNEMTKQLVMRVEPTMSERELDKMAKDVKQSFDSPVESITNELAELTNDENVSAKKLKQSLKSVIAYVFWKI